MSGSNVIDLREVLEKKPPVAERSKCFASTRETMELLQAFSRIESAFLRGAIIKTAREPHPWLRQAGRRRAAPRARSRKRNLVFGNHAPPPDPYHDPMELDRIEV